MAGSFSVSTIFRGRDRLSPVFNRMGRSAMGFGNVMRRVIGPLSAAFSVRQIVRFGNESIELWNAQAAAIANVEATLKSTSGTVGRSLQELQAQAAELQRKTFFGDESIMQGATAQLLTFTNITGTAFDRAQQAALDVTAKLNGLDATEESLRSTSIMLGKALNDPIANLGALSRSGIQFAQEQKDLIKQLVESGNMMEAQNIILTELERQYGGTAAAIAQTSGGMERQVQNLTGDMRELVGQGLTPMKLQILTIQKDLLQKFGPALVDIATKIGDWATENLTLNNILETGRNFLDRYGGIIGTVTTALVAWKLATLGVLAAQKAQAAFLVIGKLLQFLRIIGMITKAKGLWAAAQWAINFAMNANPIGLIITGVAALIAGVIALAANWDKVTAAVQRFFEWLQPVTDFFQGIGEGIGKLFDPSGTAGVPGENRDAPNRREAEARRRIEFDGTMTFENAPDGATFDSTTRGAPPVRMRGLGTAP